MLFLASLAYNFNFLVIDYIRPFLVSGGMSLPDTALLYTAQGTGVLLGSFAMASCVAWAGAKRTLIGATVAMAVATASHEAVTTFPAWLLTRFVVGVTLAGCYVSTLTMLANLYSVARRGRLAAMNMATFSVALMAIGALGATLGESGWRDLLRVGAAAPLAVALMAALLLPDDRARVAEEAARDHGAGAGASGAWREMFGPALRRRTLACLLLAGLNFSAYQFYSGFITTYLLTVRHFDTGVTGLFVLVDGVGTLAGSFLWGYLADRVGRRSNALGFLLAPVFIVAVLAAPAIPWALLLLEFGYAVCLSCANVWGAYFAELFPVRLRPMGTALFHGGHVVSLLAPRLVAAVAAWGGLVPGMALAPATFLIAAVIWRTLPETLPVRTSAPVL